MMDAETKKAVRARLRRIAGQVQAVERMVDEDRYCIELMHQLAAVQAAIGKAGEVILRSRHRGHGNHGPGGGHDDAHARHRHEGGRS